MREKKTLKTNKMDEQADAYIDLLIARKVLKVNRAGNLITTKKFRRNMRKVSRAMGVHRPNITKSRHFPLDDVIGCSLIIGTQDFLELDKSLGVSRKELAKSGGVLCFFLRKSSDWDGMRAYLDGLEGLQER